MTTSCGTHQIAEDSDNHVVRAVGRDGTIRTIAGRGERAYDDDGVPALSARLDSRQSLALDEQRRLYIGDEHNHAISVVELDGTVRTLIGRKSPGFSGDGGPAADSQLADPENILVRRDRTILITARDNSLIRMIGPDGIIRTFAGRGPTRYYAP